MFAQVINCAWERKGRKSLLDSTQGWSLAVTGIAHLFLQDMLSSILPVSQETTELYIVQR